MESSKRLRYSRIIFSTGIVLLTALSILFLYETHQENTSSQIIYHSQLVKHSLERIYSQLNEREGALRGFLLTRDPKHFFSSSIPQLDRELRHLDSLIADSETQQTHAKQLKDLISITLSKHDSIVTVSTHGALSADDTYMLIDSNRKKLDQIKAVVQTMKTHETSSSKQKELDVQVHTIIATLVGAAASIFSIIVFVLAFYFIDQELKRSQQYINESKELNKKIAVINTELENANHNLKGLNAELASKNFQLEKYAKELSSFTHITSHDMQEPLRKIEFFISVIESQETKNLSNDGQRYLEKIKRSVARMRKLFLSMLEFSLTNTTDNTIEDVNLNEILSLTLQSLKTHIKETNASVECSTLPFVRGIRYQLLQLFENIIGNSIKFKREDIPPRIHIRSTAVSGQLHSSRGLKPDLTYNRIDFIDNGVGFDPKYAEKIFDIFQRLTPHNDIYGVGIGLAICRRIAENHGGILIANSTPGEGSTFSVFIPIPRTSTKQ